MGIYVCLGCGATFDEPKIETESHEFWGMPCNEEFYTCPACGSAEVESADSIREEFRKEYCYCCRKEGHCTEEIKWVENDALMNCGGFIESEE